MVGGRDGRWSEWEGRDTGWAGGEMGEGADAARMTDDDDGGDGMRGRTDRPRPSKAKAAPKSRQMGAGRAREGARCTATECSIV